MLPAWYNLRARYLDTGIGRFLTRDTWGGDYIQPMSLNRWMYVEGNPILLIDPSGFVPKKEEVGINFFYSCNCGWLDFGHANPSNTLELINRVYAKVNRPQNINVVDDIRIIRADVYTPIKLSLKKYIAVKENHSDKAGTILGMYMGIEEFREQLQCFVRYGNSCYSEEDLSSDIIGFYMAINNRFGNNGDKLGDPRYDEKSYKWLAEICGMPKDRGAATIYSNNIF